MGKVRPTFSEDWRVAGCSCQGSARGRFCRASPTTQGWIRRGALDRQTDRGVNVLVHYKSFGGNYVLFMCTSECIWIFITDIFQRCKQLEAIRGEHAPQRNVSGVTWLAQGVKSIHVLKSSQKLAFKGTESEWNLKVLSHDCEVPGFKRKM